MNKTRDRDTLGFQVNTEMNTVTFTTTKVAPIKQQPLYNVLAAREPITHASYELIAKMVPQDDFVSDGNVSEWLDDEP